jgi:hypothetical protein
MWGNNEIARILGTHVAVAVGLFQIVCGAALIYRFDPYRCNNVKKDSFFIK